MSNRGYVSRFAWLMGTVATLVFFAATARGDDDGSTFGPATLPMVGVDAATGNIRASVKFIVPAARGGLQPLVNGLTYSYGGQREAGEGWGLGLPSIERDNGGELLTYGGNDPRPGTALDGNKVDRFTYMGSPLVPMCTLGLPDSTCPVDGSGYPEWATTGHFHLFRLQHEGMFARFFWSADGKTWVIQMPDGETRELGYSRLVRDNQLPPAVDVDTRVDPPTSPAFQTLKITRWKIATQRRVLSDVKGGTPERDGFVAYLWAKDGTRGFTYLQDVFDTVVAGGSVQKFNADYVHHTHLAWAPAPSTASSNGPLLRQRLDMLLSRVEVTSKTFLGDGEREHVRRYFLTYRTADNRAYLESVTNEGKCLATPLREKIFTAAGVKVLPVDLAPLCPAMPAMSFVYAASSEAQVHSDPQMKCNQLALPGMKSAALESAAFYDADQDGLADLVEAVDLEHVRYQHNNGSGFDDAISVAVVQPPPVQAVPSLPPETQTAPLFSVDRGGPNDPHFWGVSVFGNWYGRGRQDILFSPRLDPRVVLSASGYYSKFYQFASTPSDAGAAAPFKFQFVNNVLDVEGLRPGTHWEQPSIAYIEDIDGNGLPDLVTRYVDTNDVPREPKFRVLFSHKPRESTREGTTEPFSIIGDATGNAAYAPPAGHKMFMAEMDGDGIPDFAEYNSLTGDITITSGYGDGRFGPGVTRHIRQFNTDPYPNPANTYLVDVSGDGRADVIFERSVGLEILVNTDAGFRRFGYLPNFRWSGKAGDPVNGHVRLKFADVMGTGVSNIVFVTDGSIPAIAYECASSQGEKGLIPAGILTDVYNGMGGHQHFSSTLTTTLSSSPAEWSWATRSPLAVPVVFQESSETTIPTDLQVPSMTSYAYRDPIFDGWTHRLLGFETVYTARTSASESVRTISTYDSTPCFRISFAQPCKGQAIANGYDRFLAGFHRTMETDETKTANRIMSTQVSVPYVQNVGVGNDGRYVSFRFASQTDTYVVDSTDFSTTESTVLTVDSNDAYLVKNLKNSSGETVKVTVPAAAGARLRRAEMRDGQGHVRQSVDLGRINAVGQSLDGELRTTSGWEDVSKKGDWIWRKTSSVTPPVKRTHATVVDYQREAKLVFDTLGRLTSRQGFLEGTLPLKRRHADPQKAFSPGPADASNAGSFVELASYEYDSPFGNVSRERTPNGGCSDLSYDDLAGQLIVGATAYSGGCKDGVSAPGTGPLSSSMAFDRGLEARTMSVSPSKGVSLLTLDGFGRVLFSYVPLANGPGHDDVAQESATYRNPYAGFPFQTVTVVTRTGATWANAHTSSTYLDGFGHAVFRMRSADTSAGDAKAFLIDGVTMFPAGNARVRELDPTFDDGDPVGFIMGGKYRTVAGTTSESDGMGRVLGIYDRNGLRKKRVVYGPLTQTVYDAEDDLPGGAHADTPVRTERDGHGRVAAKVATFKDSTGARDTLRIAYHYLAAGELAGIEQRHALGSTENFTRWMRYDSLGRLVMNGEPNTTVSFSADAATADAGALGWRYVYNNAGQLVGTSDARGCGKDIAYDGLGRVVSEDFSPCASGQPDYTPAARNGDNAEVFFVYDAPEGDQASQQNGNALAWAGELAATYSRGEQTRFAYDFLGHQIRVDRRMARPGGASGPLDGRYANHWYHAEVDFDQVDRVIRRTTGAELDDLRGAGSRAELLYAYSARGIQTSIAGSYGTLLHVNNVDENGLTTGVDYGDKILHASFDYEQGTKQLHSAEIRRSAASTAAGPRLLSKETYSYDNAGSLTGITDGRTVGEWINGYKPITQTITVDDLGRTTNVVFDAGGDLSPVGAAPPPADSANLPVTTAPKRPSRQSFTYDWLGNTSEWTDDANAFFDRSMGTMVNGDVDPATSARRAPNQLRQTTYPDGSGTSVEYDSAGNMTNLFVRRAKCDAADSKCSHVFAYDWDEVGQLARARRWDFVALPANVSRAAVEGLPTAAESHFTYDGSGSRVIKERDRADGPALFNVDIFATLRLVGVQWLSDAPSGGGLELSLAASSPSTKSLRSARVIAQPCGIVACPPPAVGSGGSGDYEQSASGETVYLEGLGRVLKVPDAASIDDLHPGSRVRTFLELPDTRGGTATVVDRDTGELVERTTYQPYGATENDYKSPRWGSFREDMRLTGKEEDLEFGLLYFGARYYSPHLGRWLSADPLAVHGAAADPNPYAYVGGNVLGSTDVLGLYSVSDPPSTGHLDTDGFWVYDNGDIEILDPDPDPVFLPYTEPAPAPAPTPSESYDSTGAVWANYDNTYDRWNPTASSGNGAMLLGSPRQVPWAERHPEEAQMGADATMFVLEIAPVSGVAMAAIEVVDPHTPRAKRGGAAIMLVMAVIPAGKLLAKAEKAGAKLLFGQANVGLRFANGKLAGRTIGEVAKDLRAGALTPNDLPIDFIVRDGERITLNNRSLTALSRAKMEPTIMIDRTGVAEFEKQLVEQLRGGAPSTTIRIRAGVPGVSSIE